MEAAIKTLPCSAAASSQVEQLQRQAAARDAAAARELQAAREEVQRQSSAKNRYIERAAELDTQLTRAKAEHRAELAGLASDKKELQAQVGGRACKAVRLCWWWG